MATQYITPVDVTPGVTGSFQDVDVSANVSASATGVILHVVNTNVSTDHTAAFRKNGATDTSSTFHGMTPDSHTYVYVGVDGSQIFEANIDSADIDIYLVGYFESEAVFFTEPIDHTADVVSANTYTDIDISSDTGGDTAIGAIVRVNVNSQSIRLRKNGSTDSFNLYPDSVSGANYFVVGVDGSEIFEIYAQTSLTLFELEVVGYITSGWTFLTNATDLSIGATDTWTDLTTLPAGATGAAISVSDTSAKQYWGLRKDGSAEALIYDTLHRSASAIVEASSQIVEGYIEATSVDFYLMGYSEASGGWANVAKVGGISEGSVAEIGEVAKASIAKVAGVTV